jgi:hypothetical protein
VITPTLMDAVLDELIGNFSSRFLLLSLQKPTPEFVLTVKPRLGVGKTKRGKGTKIMAVADRRGLPIAVCTESATPYEVTLVQQTLAEIFVEEPVERLIGDNAYDSDQRDRELASFFF